MSVNLRADKPFKLDGRGFRPTGTGRKGRCPHCGKAISHGLPGNPYTRKFQPCQRDEIRAAEQRAAELRAAEARAARPAEPTTIQATLDGLTRESAGA